MRKGRWWLASVFGGIAVMLGASIAMATDLDPGEYSLELPGIGEFTFDVQPGVTHLVVMVDGYEIDDDDDDKAAWKDASEFEIEAKTDRVEGDWNGEVSATLTLPLPDGGTITVYKPGHEITDPVVADNGWSAIGLDDDWYAYNDSETKFFKVEFDDDGFEFKPVADIPENLLKDIEEEEEVEVEALEAEEDDDGEGKGRGGNPNN